MADDTLFSCCVDENRSLLSNFLHCVQQNGNIIVKEFKSHLPFDSKTTTTKMTAVLTRLGPTSRFADSRHWPRGLSNKLVLGPLLLRLWCHKMKSGNGITTLYQIRGGGKRHSIIRESTKPHHLFSHTYGTAFEHEA